MKWWKLLTGLLRWDIVISVLVANVISFVLFAAMLELAVPLFTIG